MDNETLVREHIVEAPFAALLGLRLERFATDEVCVRLPYRTAVTTLGELLHGGALSALIDVAATAAAWSRADLARGPRGTTIGLTVNFLNGAQGRDVLGTARVVQRGSSIVVCEVQVRDEAGAGGAGAGHLQAQPRGLRPKRRSRGRPRLGRYLSWSR